MKRIIPLLLLFLSISSCNKKEDESSGVCNEKEVESFKFSLRWGIQGNYMYDAKEEVAYKEFLSSEKEKYSNKISFSDETKKDIIDKLNNICIYSYPDKFNPFKPSLKTISAQEPQYKIILDLNDKVIETIDCMPDIDNEEFRKMCTTKAIKFFDCITEITNYIVETDIWKATPTGNIYFD